MNCYILTHVDYGKKKTTGLTFWDPNSGLPVKSLPFENLTDKCLCTTSDGYIITNIDNKPLLQTFDLIKPCEPIKKFSLNYSVNCVVADNSNDFIYFGSKSEILLYSKSSGTICGKLSNVHSANIKSMIIIEGNLNFPKTLISCDINGMLACWNLASSLLKDSKAVSSNNSSNIKPIWFSVRISSDLPCICYSDSLLFVGSSNTLKLIDARTGSIKHQIDLKEVVTSLYIEKNTRKLFIGSENGALIHSTIPVNIMSGDFSFKTRNCFSSSNEKFDKSITGINCIAENSTLVVSCRGGQIDILRNDAFLTKIQTFSSIQNEFKSAAEISPYLKEVTIIQCPDWSNNNSKLSSKRMALIFQRKDFNDPSCLFSKLSPPSNSEEDMEYFLNSFDIFKDSFFRPDHVVQSVSNSINDIAPVMSRNENQETVQKLMRENMELNQKILCLQSYM